MATILGYVVFYYLARQSNLHPGEFSTIQRANRKPNATHHVPAKQSGLFPLENLLQFWPRLAANAERKRNLMANWRLIAEARL
jgi:hypothetical protein